MTIPITVMKWAEHRLGREASTEADFTEAGLQMMGGCRGCGATLAAYNAYPSKSGYWACGDCISYDGFGSCEEAESWRAQDQREEEEELAADLALVGRFYV